MTISVQKSATSGRLPVVPLTGPAPRDINVAAVAVPSGPAGSYFRANRYDQSNARMPAPARLGPWSRRPAGVGATCGFSIPGNTKQTNIPCITAQKRTSTC
ncbi:hypothetical protein GCM10011315_28680 [Roseovarius pacificus]|nr:hypothetical protein GCM10011315_28680 [Roseovarius pacificus]